MTIRSLSVAVVLLFLYLSVQSANATSVWAEASASATNGESVSSSAWIEVDLDIPTPAELSTQPIDYPTLRHRRLTHRANRVELGAQNPVVSESTQPTPQKLNAPKSIDQTTGNVPSTPLESQIPAAITQAVAGAAVPILITPINNPVAGFNYAVATMFGILTMLFFDTFLILSMFVLRPVKPYTPKALRF